MSRIKLFSNFILILLITSNGLLVLLFIYVKKQNTTIECIVNSYYSTSYKSFNRILDEVQIIRSSDLQKFKEIKYFDSIFIQYLKIPNKGHKDLIELKILLTKYHDEETMKNLYYEFDYQNRIIDTNKDITSLYDIHISQIRDKLLFNKLSLLSYYNRGLFISNFVFFRVKKLYCDDVFFGSYIVFNIYKVEYPNFSKIFDQENHFKIPKSDFEKFKDSLKISVLNYEGNKFIPAEVHFLN